uniref:30S ribosomal protein S6, chloroplastic n=1 Tax=Dunaliella tertiolecta TaxID=3047 RepID=A0A7S3R7V7_DUNTE|mmetsp:Transcript_26605/g.71956  ORF Transcript_26605/g.71956 Transcript_26605/m.71956 type:complete len:108 (-) Transcript_26605:449-772(-)|eukprot:CAMPEP_0202354636 /NCGR_PEP_ID=MMETSP1126-20121109/9871_1 /ASSEMBLY_ACC=CAM_ASM_000457 /TAXON_ID=3047 /ORGANISM="Dunaliella tertiolecta, Strain CCMP1320" /LENGTH=107 /DNA_ID=CAMNT_0048947131 /DNA_START=85 /DNA_END=408 /DNA_ORIENTATION=-
MPLYELLCLAKPALGRPEQVRMLQRVAEKVMDHGGVLTRLTSYGEQHLAYDIRKPFQRYDKALVWQANFVVAPNVLRELNHELSVNKDVLRWVSIRRSKSILPGLPH